MRDTDSYLVALHLLDLIERTPRNRTNGPVLTSDDLAERAVLVEQIRSLKYTTT